MRVEASGYPAGLLAPSEPPCLSIYQPTHRSHPANAQDPVRFRNLLRDAEAQLAERYPNADADTLLAPFRRIARDALFWSHLRDGLAVLGGSGQFRTFTLQRAVPESLTVGDRFHIRPLIRILQSADRYQVLGLSLDDVHLYEGNRDTLDEIELHAEVPRTLVDALGAETGPVPGRFDRGGGKDDAPVDTERWFRAVDRAVLEHHSQPTGLPLVLAALPEHQGRFRALSHNPHLLDAGIDMNARDLARDELRARAWAAIEPAYLTRLAELVDEFGWARSSGLGTDDIAEADAASSAGRIATLLVEADRDLPTDLDERVLRLGGEVIVVPAARMPTHSGIAATFRF